jgi:flavin reductase (DIM6/NTAB) family NADH-FMN oxidoreductase RutF
VQPEPSIRKRAAEHAADRLVFTLVRAGIFPAPVTAADDFEAVMGELDSPMFLVTCHPPGRDPAGCLVGFASQCSIDPPRFLACISRANQTADAARASTVLAVHLLPRSAEPLAGLFGGQTGDETDKFSRCAWHPGPKGAPILDECPNWFVGNVCDRLDLGDHVGLVLEPVAAAHRPDHDALGLIRAAETIEPGHPA